MIHLANAAFIKIAFGCSALLTVGVVALRLIAALTPSLETLAVAGLLDALPGTVTSGFANLLGLAEMSLRVLGPVVIISRSSVPAALACSLLSQSRFLLRKAVLKPIRPALRSRLTPEGPDT